MHTAPQGLARFASLIDIEAQDHAGERPVLPKCLRGKLASATGESLPVVEPSLRIEHSLCARAVRVALGVHVGVRFQDEFLRIVRGGDALPRAGPQRGCGFGVREKDRCSPGDPGVAA